MAVEIGVLQHPVRFLAADVEVALQDDAVLGQRPGLVGAQDIHRAEVLNGVEPLDDDLLARHRDRALGQVDGHDHRQHFRREADRDRDGEQQRFQPIVLGQAVDQEHGRHHHQDEPDHQPGEPVDALVEGGRYAPPGDLVGELAEKGLRPGAHDDAGRIAAHDVGAHKADIGQVERIVELLFAGVGELLRRHRLAGQGRLIDEEVLGLEQAKVRRDHVAGRQPYDVAGHQRSPSGPRQNRRSRDRHGRLTLAVVFTMARSRAAASLERCSWMKAVVIARRTIAAMTTAARISPRK